MSYGDWHRLSYPNSGFTEDQYRCLGVLESVKGLYNWSIVGDSSRSSHNRLNGGFTPCGRGIEVKLRSGESSMSTCDSDELTRIVVRAHRLRVRLCICPSFNGLKLYLHPREADGDLMTRHPGLDDLIARCEKAKQA